MIRRFNLLDAIVNLSSKPVSACQASRRDAAEENHDNTDESDQRRVKSAVVAKAVGTALHNTHHSKNWLARQSATTYCTNIVSRGKALRHVNRPRLRSTARRQEVSGADDRPIRGHRRKVVLDVGCDTGRNFPLLARRVGRTHHRRGLRARACWTSHERERSKRDGRALHLTQNDAYRLPDCPAPCRWRQRSPLCSHLLI